MKFNVHAGHNPDGKTACGAVGLIKESTEARAVKELVIKYLKAEGHTVYDCTVDNGTSQSDVLVKIVNKCNAHSVDLDISIHFNAGASDKSGNGKTTGVEVLVYNSSSKAKSYASDICAAIAALGFKNRGVKYSTSLYVLRKTNSPALLIECCFVDDKDDVDLYNADAMARAIVKGITGKAVSGTAAESSTKQTSGTENKTTDAKTEASASSSSKTMLDVDGLWGKATTKRAQEVFGTTVDSVVSNQYKIYSSDNPGLLSTTFSWKNNPSSSGSQLIKAIQKKVGVTADGFIGPKTIKAMQKWLGTTQDGYVSKPSQMVKAFQTWLNKQ